MSSIPTEIAYSVFYTDGQFLTAASMQMQADYFSNWIQLQTSMLYNPGILQGLDVTASGASTLMVAPGGGLNAAGNFLILPGNGGSITVNSQTATPLYVYLVYPSPGPLVAANVRNMAAQVSSGTSPAAPPNGIVLAKVTLANGAIAGIDNSVRVAVTAKVAAASRADVAAAASPANAAVVGASFTAAPSTTTRTGTATVPGQGLDKPGATVVTQITFGPSGAPQFSVPPMVTATTQGPVPFATTVSGISTTGFTLTVTAITTGIVPADTLAVSWIATGA
ncbi:hypothetical protein [Magnetospirillum aberrantis]|uniref:Uncharacterized protein n=1 Tax=Magnetospirillum aberrantis SpK TaxID=908842 RepID=A0A7C9QUB3_9PROT|nr:hypothetical protein [Magnetospirillum aberrantis]NFV80341.1 hypothetical protein [Magnetospirillum aberrantis SpK]